MSALDVETRLALRKVIKQIQKEFGTTMIYITHDQEEAFAMSDRILVMEEAKISHNRLHATESHRQSSKRVCIQVRHCNLQEKIDSLSRYAKVMP